MATGTGAVSPNGQDSGLYTDLLNCARDHRGTTETLADKVQPLLASGRILINPPQGSPEMGPVDFAINHPRVAQQLLNANVNPTRYTLRLALSVDAGTRGREEMMQALFKSKLPPLEEDLFSIGARYLVVAINKKHTFDTLGELMGRGAGIPPQLLENNPTILNEPLTNDLREFLLATLSPEKPQPQPAQQIRLQPYSEKLEGRWRNTLAMEGSGAEITRLIDQGQVFNGGPNQYGALDIVTSTGEATPELINRLLDVGAEVSRRNALAAFLLMCENMPLEVVVRVIEQGKAQIGAGDTSVLVNAIGRQSKEVIEMLIARGARASPGTIQELDEMSDDRLGVHGLDAVLLRQSIKAAAVERPVLREPTESKRPPAVDLGEQPAPRRERILPRAAFLGANPHIYGMPGERERLGVPQYPERERLGVPLYPAPPTRYCAWLDRILPAVFVRGAEWICRGIVSFCDWLRGLVREAMSERP